VALGVAPGAEKIVGRVLRLWHASRGTTPKQWPESVWQTPPMALLRAALGLVETLLSGRSLILENLALRQQLAVLRRATPRPKLRPVDRLFWVALARLWPRWREALHLVKPETVIAWHRAGFRLLWR
jgi:hypothetical protein